jgi:hypothetical protein
VHNNGKHNRQSSLGFSHHETVRSKADDDWSNFISERWIQAADEGTYGTHIMFVLPKLTLLMYVHLLQTASETRTALQNMEQDVDADQADLREEEKYNPVREFARTVVDPKTCGIADFNQANLTLNPENVLEDDITQIPSNHIPVSYLAVIALSAYDLGTFRSSQKYCSWSTTVGAAWSNRVMDMCFRGLSEHEEGNHPQTNPHDDFFLEAVPGRRKKKKKTKKGMSTVFVLIV